MLSLIASVACARPFASRRLDEQSSSMLFHWSAKAAAKAVPPLPELSKAQRLREDAAEAPPLRK